MNKTKTKKLEMVLMDRPLLEVSKLGGSERSTQGQIGFCELLTVFGFARHTIIRGWHDGTPCDFNVFMSTEELEKAKRDDDDLFYEI